MKSRNKGVISILFGMLGIMIAMPIFAATLEAEERLTFDDVINDDLYAAGGQIVVRESVVGDAIITGGQIHINGDVAQDLNVIGGNINVTSATGDDLRAAGGDIILSGSVGDDVVIVGGNIFINKDVVVSGDAVITGGVIIIDGTVNGNLKILGGDVVLNGIVRGLSIIQGEEVELNGTMNGKVKVAGTHMRLGDEASFGEDVEYWRADGELDFGEALVGGTATFNEDVRLRGDHKKAKKEALAGFLAAWTIFSFLSAAVIILILTLVYHRVFRIVGRHYSNKIWKHVGIGVLYFLVMPVISIVLFVTLIGWPLGLAVLFVYILSVIFACPVAAVSLTQLAVVRYKKDWKRGMLFAVSLGIYIVLKILMLIPVVGWIVVFLAISGSYGAILVTKMDVYKRIEHQ